VIVAVPASSREDSLRGAGAVLLLSFYELGHAPHGLAVPAAVLEGAGFEPRVVDLAVTPLADEAITAARFVGLSVPMHTALRLAMPVAARIRTANPEAHLCFYGLYAPLCRDIVRAGGADSVLGGEHEQALLALVAALAADRAAAPVEAAPLVRLAWPRPSRAGLPPLAAYAKLVRGGRQHLAGYSETSRGCLHTCRHCPIPPVYGGRFFVVDAATVLADVAAQVDAGARHITFGDPDFLCGPKHSFAILHAAHERFPDLTFDVTIKVSHLLAHSHRLAELVDLGCAFVVTAAESLSDDVLARLAKGHTRADFERVLALADAAGLVVRPTFVPFTPWTTWQDVVELADFIVARDLVDRVDPIQLTIRLLCPPGSLLLAALATRDAFGPLDPTALTHVWAHADPSLDRLQRDLCAIVERASAAGAAPHTTFAALRDHIHLVAGGASPPAPAPRRRAHTAPRLTEPWFC
jgi:radical SAM superfamily enzyme YgiQ (UPF0313 family)